MKYSIGDRVYYNNKEWEVFQYTSGIYQLWNKDLRHSIKVTEEELLSYDTHRED